MNSPQRGWLRESAVPSRQNRLADRAETAGDLPGPLLLRAVVPVACDITLRSVNVFVTSS